MAKRKSTSKKALSRRYNLQQLGGRLERRVQQARKQIAADQHAGARELWSTWEDASRFPVLAERFWPAGRDAVQASLTFEREVGCQRLTDLTAILLGFSMSKPAASSLHAIAAELSDEELVEIAVRVDLSRETLLQLPEELRERLRTFLEFAITAAPETKEQARFLGRLLSLEETDPIVQRDIDQRSDEAKELRWKRWHGSESIGGPVYEAQYALWRLFTEDTIVELDLQDLEDIGIVHRLADGETYREHIQVKKRAGNWSIPALQNKRSDANKVFDSFAEVSRVEPNAKLTFASDAQMTSGKAPELVSAAAKLRELSVRPHHDDAAALAAAGITTSEQEALRQLIDRMDVEVLGQINVCELLSKIHFDAGRSRRELRSELIRRISAQLDVADPEAEATYHTFVGEFVEAMEARRQYTRSELIEMVERAATRASAFRTRLAISGQIELLDFEGLIEASADRFYQGLSASPADIAAGLDALRPALLAEIDLALEEYRCCIVRAPSGQGKTSLMYRYAYEKRDDLLIVRVHGHLNHQVVGEILSIVDPLDHASLLVLVDDVARGDTQQWPSAVRRLLERRNILVLATSREDDWQISAVSSLEDFVGFVHPRLDEHTAQVIYSGLSDIEGLQLHAAHWLEPFENAAGLLMEYVHLLTQGRRMRDVISEQINHIEQRLGARAAVTLDALRWITTAHMYGGYVSRGTLSRLVTGADAKQLGRELRFLEEEFWIRDTGDGRYSGLHQVRSGITTAVLHEYDPLAHTVERLISEMDAEELGTILEDLLYRVAEEALDVIPLLADRARTADIRFGLRVLVAAYAADERRFADAVVSAIPENRRARNLSFIPLLTVAPFPVESVSGFLDILPSLARQRIEADISALPQRELESRCSFRFLQLVGTDRLAEWIARHDAAGDLIELLQLLALAAPTIGQAVLEDLDINALSEEVERLDMSHRAEFMEALRVLSPIVANAVYDWIGPDRMLEVAVLSIEGCCGASIDGVTVRGRFLTSLNDDVEAVNERANQITEALYALFPGASESEVLGLRSSDEVHPDGEKRRPRTNLPPPRSHRAFNQYWLHLCSQRQASTSLVQVLRQHDEYGEALSSAIRMALSFVDHRSQVHRKALTDAWNQLNSRAALPQTAPTRDIRVLDLIRRLEANAVSGGTAIDRAFDRLSTSAASAFSELAQQLLYRASSSDWRRCARLLDDLHRDAMSYQEARLDLQVLDELDEGWLAALPAGLDRLFEAIGLAAASRGDRPYRAQAQQLFEEFAELRSYAESNLAEAWDSAERGRTWSPNPERVRLVREWMNDIDSQLDGWEPVESLVKLVTWMMDTADSGSSRITTLDDDQRIDEMKALWREVDSVEAFNLETWLVHQAQETEIQEISVSTSRKLIEGGITGQCVIAPLTRGDWLSQSATMAVTVDLHDTREIHQIQEAVKSIVFAGTPDEISQIHLLLRHQEGLILPSAFQVSRISDIINNPYAPLNPFAPWHPIHPRIEITQYMKVAIDERHHPVLDRIMGLANVRNQVHQALVRYGSVSSVASDEGWVFRIGAVTDEVSMLLGHFSDLGDSAQELVEALAENTEPWQTIGRAAIDGVSDYLSWLLKVAQDEPDEVLLIESVNSLGSAIAQGENHLYLDLEPSQQTLPIRGSIDRFSELLQGVIPYLDEEVQDLKRRFGLTSSSHEDPE